MEAGKSFAVRSEITLDNQIENRNDTCRQTKNITHDKQIKVLAKKKKEKEKEMKYNISAVPGCIVAVPGDKHSLASL